MSNPYMNDTDRTYSVNEICEVMANKHERWRGLIPIKHFRIKRGVHGGVLDCYVNTDAFHRVNYPLSVIEIARQLVYTQEGGKRLLYTPKGIRAEMLHRSLFPSALTLKYDNIFTDQDNQVEITEKEWDIIKDFLRTVDTKTTPGEVKYDDQLKWSSDNVHLSFFASEAKCLAGQRTRYPVSKYFQSIAKKAPSDVVRDAAAALLAAHDDVDRYQIHVADSATEIECIYEQSNVPSCMVRARMPDETIYINSELDNHPVIAYDVPDIQVIGLFDTEKNCYVARVVTRKSKKQYCIIYPVDRSGMRGTCVARLEKYLENSGYVENDDYLTGIELRYVPAHIDGEPIDAICMPFIDGNAQHVRVINGAATLIALSDIDAVWPEHVYAANNTNGLAGGVADEY